jgi:arylsulfatase A-like enzyme
MSLYILFLFVNLLVLSFSIKDDQPLLSNISSFKKRKILANNKSKKDGHPNILFVLVDDVGWGDISYNSKFSKIPTPNIDILANHGIKLNNYYVQSLCTPSRYLSLSIFYLSILLTHYISNNRASFLTGRYAFNTGLHYVLVPGSPAGIQDNIPTLPSLLKKINYKTAMVGKWHLGSFNFIIINIKLQLI